MPEMKNDDKNIQMLDKNFFKALDRCVNTFTLNDLSHESGVRIELLRRYVDRQVRHIRKETWDKIYPALKPYLEAPVPVQEPPPRIGAPYRRHPELVEMLSEQKVLLDEFQIFSDSDRKSIIRKFSEALGKDAEPTTYSSLSAQENTLMGIYMAMPQEMRDTELADLTAKATAEARKRRSELF